MPKKPSESKASVPKTSPAGNVAGPAAFDRNDDVDQQDFAKFRAYSS